jgi:hypothetical protein
MTGEPQKDRDYLAQIERLLGGALSVKERQFALEAFPWGIAAAEIAERFGHSSPSTSSQETSPYPA